MRKLKVFGGNIFVYTASKKREQLRAIVAATSQKRVSEIVGETINEVRKYWCETGNAVELETALSSPETVFVAEGNHYGAAYKRLEDIQCKHPM